MSDRRLRELERAALTGGAAEEGALLYERVRLGELELDRVHLASYCGHEGARVLGSPFMDSVAAYLDGHDGQDCYGLKCWDWPLSAFVTGLEHWTGHVLTRAVVAAAWVALPAQETYHSMPCDRQLNGNDPCICSSPARRVLEAAEAWLACPCREHLAAWMKALRIAFRSPRSQLGWLPCPSGQAWCSSDPKIRILIASEMVQETEVREAIKAGLIEWALQ